jgi:hypothetical protein
MRLFLFIVAVLSSTGWTSAGASPDSVPVDELRAFSDPEYIGGLNREGVSLAKRIAAQIDAAIPGQSVPCGEPGSMRATFAKMDASRGGDQDPHELAQSLSLELQKWVAIVRGGSPVQKAIAIYSVGLVGTKAHVLSKLIWSNSVADGWVAESAGQLSCDNFRSGGLAKLVPAPVIAESKEEAACGATRRSWLLSHTLDPSRRWPPVFIKDAWREISESCRGEKGTITLPDSATLPLAAMLRGEAFEMEYKTAWLDVLGHNIAVPAELANPLEKLTSSPNADLAFAAQRALIATGTEQGARQFARWLSVDHVDNWRWYDVAPHIQAHLDIVLPALTDALHSEMFSDRETAVKVLGELRTVRAIPLLESAIDPADWSTTEAVVNALAPISSEDPKAAQLLADISESYWSRRVRAVARIALRTGRPVTIAPLQCGSTPIELQEPAEQTSSKKLHETDDDGMERLECISSCPGCLVDHQLPCEDRGRRRDTYQDEVGNSLKIRWKSPRRERLPRVKAGSISDWCWSEGTTTSLAVDGGWLMGCEGFESSGRLVFVPDSASPTSVPILDMGVAGIVRAGNRIYAFGRAWSEVGGAGGLFEIRRDTRGSWSAVPVATLPAVATDFAVIGNRIAFRDEDNVVIFDPSAGISALSCGTH